MSDQSEVGFIGVDSWGEKSFAVPIQHFDFDRIDSPEDFVRERIAQGKEITPLLHAWAKHLAEHEQAKTVRALIALVIQAKKPRQRIDEIAFACGMLATEGATCESLGKKHGISKQAFQNAVEKVCDTLGLRKLRTMRSDEARAKMRKANFRQTTKTK